MFILALAIPLGALSISWACYVGLMDKDVRERISSTLSLGFRLRFRWAYVCSYVVSLFKCLVWSLFKYTSSHPLDMSHVQGENQRKLVYVLPKKQQIKGRHM